MYELLSSSINAVFAKFSKLPDIFSGFSIFTISIAYKLNTVEDRYTHLKARGCAYYKFLHYTVAHH